MCGPEKFPPTDYETAVDDLETLTPGTSAVASITLGVENDVKMLPLGSYLTTGSKK